MLDRMRAEPSLRLWDAILRWHRRAVERRAMTRHSLSALSARELRDLGISPSDPWEEVRKPHWMG